MNATAQISARNICTGASVPTGLNTKEMHFLPSPLGPAANLFQATASHRTTRIPRQSPLSPTESCHLAAARAAAGSPERRPFIQQLRCRRTAALNIHFPVRNRRVAFQRGKGSDSAPLGRLAQQINKSDTPLLELILWMPFLFFLHYQLQ